MMARVLLGGMGRAAAAGSRRTMAGQQGGVGDALHVTHDQHNQEFYVKLGRSKAVLQYEVMDPATGAVDLQHTVVPEAFRGRGIAKVLAKTALDYFASSSQQMKLTCWYLKKYYQENPLPLYQDLIIKDSS